MFLNFSKFEGQLPAVLQEEEKQSSIGRHFDRILKAENLSDVDDIKTEDMAFLMLHMNEHLTGFSRANLCVCAALSNALLAQRVRTARLL